MITTQSNAILLSLSLLAAISTTELTAMNASEGKEAKQPQTPRGTTTNTYISLTQIFAEEETQEERATRETQEKQKSKKYQNLLGHELIKNITDTKKAIDAAQTHKGKKYCEQQLNHTVNKLRKNGFNINWAESSGGWTALHYAATYGLSSCLKLLITYGANINIRAGAYKTTALNLAATTGRLDCIKYLVEAGANIDTVDINNRTALINAIAAERIDIIEYLLEIGAAPNKKAVDGVMEFFEDLLENNTRPCLTNQLDVNYSGNAPCIFITHEPEIRTAIQNGIKKHQARINAHHNLMRIAPFLAFCRANAMHPLKNSILALINHDIMPLTTPATPQMLAKESVPQKQASANAVTGPTNPNNAATSKACVIQ